MKNEINQISIYLPLKPLSFNESHCVRHGRIYSTYKLNSFKSAVREHLYEIWTNLQVFALKCSERSILTVGYTFWMPYEKLITKKGNISKTSKDVDNLIKGLQDALFAQLNKINKTIDDAQIVRLVAEKKVSLDNRYKINIVIQESKWENLGDVGVAVKT